MSSDLVPSSSVTVTHLELGQDRLVVVARDALPAAFPDTLTQAEVAVCAMLLAGNSNAAIARRRETSVHTVVNQIRTVYEKLRVFSRTELSARLFGFAEPDAP